eukprot:GSA25T00011096001.1
MLESLPQSLALQPPPTTTSPMVDERDEREDERTIYTSPHQHVVFGTTAIPEDEYEEEPSFVAFVAEKPLEVAKVSATGSEIVTRATS